VLYSEGDCEELHVRREALHLRRTRSRVIGVTIGRILQGSPLQEGETLAGTLF